MIIESSKNDDPELVEFEKLKAKVIFKEPNALENYKEYIKNKPFMKKYVSFEENRSMKHFLA